MIDLLCIIYTLDSLVGVGLPGVAVANLAGVGGGNVGMVGNGVVAVQVVHDVGGGQISPECKELLSSTVTLGGPQPLGGWVDHRDQWALLSSQPGGK